MNTKAKALAKVDQINATVSSSPIVKGLIDGGLSLIPFFGTAITSALDTRAFRLFEENSERFAEELRKAVDLLGEDKLDRQFIESDEFVSLLMEILARNARTHEQEKIKLFARVFAKFATYGKSEMPYKEGFIRIVDELSLDHVRVLSYLNDTSATFTEEDREKGLDQTKAEDVARALGITENQALAYGYQLIGFGLLWDSAIGRYDYKPGFFAITNYGHDFSEFLKEQEKS